MDHQTTAGTPGLLALPYRAPLFWLSLFALGLATFLYYPAFFPGSIHTLGAQSEAFFFESNEAAGAPVLALSLWLLYRRSHFFDVLRGPGATLAAAIALSLAGALFGWGIYTKALDLQIMSLLGLLVGVVLMLGGRPGLRAYWLPILFLGFALPISSVLLAATIFPIQLATAEYAGLLLNVIGVESLVQGDQILRPANTFIVIETCSGVRTMLTLSMLTILLIDLFERRGWHAVILIGLAPIVAFLINGVRVVTLVLNPASSIHSVHSLQGIVMLLVGLTTLYLIDGRLERILGGRRPNVEESDYGSLRDGDSSSTKRTLGMLAIASLLGFMFVFARLGPTWSGERGLSEKPAELLARVFGEDPSSPYPTDYGFIGSVHYLAQARHRVPIDGVDVEIHLGVANEQQREYSILTKRLAWPSSGYAATEETYVEIGETGPLVRRMVLRRGASSVLSYSWIARRSRFSLEWFRQAAALDRSLFVRPAHMLAIRLSTRLGPGASRVDTAERRILEVWARLAPELDGYACVACVASAASTSFGQ